MARGQPELSPGPTDEQVCAQVGKKSTENPSPRDGHQTCVVGDKLVLFGGEALSGLLADTWIGRIKGRDLTWHRSSTAISPCARWQHSLNLLDGQVFLFGGDTGDGCVNDTWTGEVRQLDRAE